MSKQVLRLLVCVCVCVCVYVCVLTVKAPPMLVNSEYKSFLGQIGNTRSSNEPNKITLHLLMSE